MHSVLQKREDASNMAVPRESAGCPDGVASHETHPVPLDDESQHTCKLLRTSWVTKNESVLPRMQPLADASILADNYRKPAAHRFQDGKIERIFERGSDEDIGGGVEDADVVLRPGETQAITNAEAQSPPKKKIGVFLADDKRAQQEVAAEGKRFEQNRKTLRPPVIANQQQNCFIWLEVPTRAGGVSEDSQLFRRKVHSIHAVGNNGDIGASEILQQFRARVTGNSGKPHAWIAINALLEKTEQPIV